MSFPRLSTLLPLALLAGIGACGSASNDKDGGRLPTDVEWNYAAAGGSEHTFSYANPCDDCADASGSAYRAARGGGFLDADTVVTTFYGPGSTAPLTRYTNYGARCPRSAG